MKREELKKLALEIRGGMVFGSWQVKERDTNLLGTIFMPLLFMEKKERDRMVKQKVRHFYSYLSNAGPRAINGYPIFTEFRCLTEKECDELEAILKALDDAEKKALENLP